jgi:hypothetical protein
VPLPSFRAAWRRASRRKISSAFERERHEVEPPLRTREEVAYFRIFAADLGEVCPSHTIGRFATT